MARKVQLKNKNGEKAYPVTSSEIVKMSSGGGTLDEKLTELEGKFSDIKNVYGIIGKTATPSENQLVSGLDGKIYSRNGWTTYTVDKIQGYTDIECNICTSSSQEFNIGLAFFDSDEQFISGYYKIEDGLTPVYSKIKLKVPENANKVMWSINTIYYEEPEKDKASFYNFINSEYVLYKNISLNDFLDGIDTQKIIRKESFIKKQILRTTGIMESESATDNDYCLDFYYVKKNVPIKIISVSDYNSSVLAFYSENNEDSLIEVIKGYNFADNNSNFKTLSLIEYTPNSDGYIRVYYYDLGIEFNDKLSIPIVIIGENSSYIDSVKNNYYNSFEKFEKEGYDGYKQYYFIKNKSITDKGSDVVFLSTFIRVKRGYKVTVYSNTRTDSEVFQFLSESKGLQCIYSINGNNDKAVVVEYEPNEDGYVLVSYDTGQGNYTQGGVYDGKTLPYIKIEDTLNQGTDGNQKVIGSIDELDGVENHNLPNLFNKEDIKSYDSDFANKVFEKIGRKTDNTGCYSNNIECKEGDWFTRSDFGTGIIVALDSDGNILGDVANAAYQPTVQITPSNPQKYDFSAIKYVVFVVPLANLEDEKIVKAKYMPTGEGDFITIPKLQIRQANLPLGLDYFIKSKSGRYYSLIVDDSGEEPKLSFIQQDGIPMSELPNDFPTFSIEGSFAEYYDSLILCPVEGGVSNYLYELSPTGLVKRYIKQKVNCPRILKEGDTWYYYGVNGSLNTSSGKLNIYKGNGETFELVKGNLGDSKGQVIEPHDCLVLSVNPLHYICQRYIPNTATIVDGESKIITSLHIEEIYEGKSVWEWHSEDYGELWKDSHKNTNNYDYLHNNTISIDEDGNLCLNCKTANQILVIKRTWSDETHTGSIGEILWKIGGNSTNEGYDVPTRIKPTSDQQWYESHDAKPNSNGIFTMYDNRENGPSRILEFGIDTSSKVLTGFKKYTWNSYRGRYMGSVDKVSEGIFLVSWGSSRGGDAVNAGIYNFNTQKKIFEIRFDATGSSAYRVYGIKKV